MLPIAVIVLAACGTAWLALHDLSQVAAARLRLTHAADAAVYSAALSQARALNLLAYINRAQVAHQVAMAHLVTLASWAQFSDTQATRRRMNNPPLYIITSFFGPAAGQGYALARDTGGAARQLADAYVAHDDLVHNVLLRAARQQVKDLPVQRVAMLQTVLGANFPELENTSQALQWRWLADNWPGFVREQPGRGGELEQLTRLATGRYDFLQPRDFTRYSNAQVYPQCPHLRHQLRRRGATQMDVQGRWSSTDTLSYHALRYNHWVGCYFREYPMGWGLAGRQAGGASVQHAPEDFSQQDFWRWVLANTSWDIFGGASNPLASVYAAVDSVSVRGRGLPAFHELGDDGSGLSLRIALAVRQQTNMPMSLPITVTSAAEAYFVRPQPRRDGGDESSTLFRPYWQARRVAVGDMEQRQARGWQ